MIDKASKSAIMSLRKITGLKILSVISVVCISCIAVLQVNTLAVQAVNEQLSGRPFQPQLSATIIVPPKVGFCRNFNFNVTVMNYGNAPAQNAHLLFKQFPGGFFTIINIDHASSRVAPYYEDIPLGELRSNENKGINFIVYVPFQKILRADWSRRFLFNFYASYDYVAEELLGSIQFLAGNGKILVQTIGFRQP